MTTSSNPEDYYRQAFARNLGLINEDEQEKLRRTRIAIAGMGGMGGAHLLTLARTGVGAFTLADHDRFEVVNSNRQVGATQETIGRLKVDVMAEMARAIYPGADLRVMREAIDESNIDRFLDGAEIVMDGLDAFAIRTRRLMFNRARERGQWVISSGPFGFSAAVTVYAPNGPSLDDLHGLRDDMTDAEMLGAFFSKLVRFQEDLFYMDFSRVDPQTGAAPSLGLATQLGASLAAVEAINILLKRRPVRAAPDMYRFDPYTHTFDCTWRTNEADARRPHPARKARDAA